MLRALLLSIAAPQGAKSRRSLTYRPGPRGRLDVYSPAAADGDAPVVVFFYGGGWRRGDRARYGFVGQVLAECGFVTVIPDYRVYPEARFPAFIQDCAAATAWAKANVSDFGGDPDKLFLMGHSAGAYNAMMLAFDGRWLGHEGMDPKRDVKGAIGLAGLYDFGEDRRERLKTIFDEEHWPHAHPIAHVDGQDPPVLLITGEADGVVDPGHTRRMASRIRALQGRVAEIVYPKLNHIMVIGVLLPWFSFRASVLEEVRRFVQLSSLEPAVADSPEASL